MEHFKSSLDWEVSKVALLGDGILAHSIKEDLEFCKTSLSSNPDTPFDFKQFSRKLQGLDVTDHATLERLLEPYNVIINCIAHTNTKDNSKSQHWSVNYKFPVFLADYCRMSKKRLIHVSTDYVYAGSNQNATEEDVCVPFNNWYSLTKLLSDQYIQLRCPDFLIVRTAHKPSPFPFPKAYTNVIGNFQSSFNANTQLQALMMHSMIGVYNIGPKEPMTIYDYATHETIKWGILESIQKEVYFGNEIPFDTSMSTAKLHDFLKFFDNYERN